MIASVGILLLVLLVLYSFLIGYYRICWNQIPNFYSNKLKPETDTFVSVIIPARNEEANMFNCLHSIISQTYPAGSFEILVVDDHSTDQTANIVRSFNSPHIRLISLQDHTIGKQLNSYKKKAIEIAIAQSKGKLIVTTDADCIMGKNWLKTLVEYYETYLPAFIAAPVCFSKLDEKVGWADKMLANFQSLDFMTMQGITGAAVDKKLHNMCNGANLAYERTAFDLVEGFKDIDSIASGDDMLLMHKIYQQNPDRVLYLKSRDAIVSTQPAGSWKEFIQQRIRWASKSDQYKDKRIFWVLFMVYLFNFLLITFPLLLLFIGSDSYWWKCWLLSILIKTGIEIYFLYSVAGFFGQRNLLLWFPFLQPLHWLYIIVAGWLGKFGSYQWKERKVK